MRTQQKNAAPSDAKTQKTALGFDFNHLKTETSEECNMNITTRNDTDFSQHNLVSQSMMGPLHKTFFFDRSPSQKKKPKKVFDSTERIIKNHKSFKAKMINDLKLGKSKFLTLKDNEDIAKVSQQDRNTSMATEP